MFDGLNQHTDRDDRRPLPAKFINIQAMLPVLRVQASQAAVEFLAYASAFNLLETARWTALRWGPVTDPSDPAHPCHTLAHDPSSPIAAAADALTSLVAACNRFKAITGGDGIALAHATVRRQFSQTITDMILNRLLECSIEFVAAGLSEAPIETAFEPTDAERMAAARVLFDHICGEGPQVSLCGPLAALESAAKTGDDGSGPAALHALALLRTALYEALQKGVSTVDLQVVLDTWTNATGALRITVKLDAL